MSFGAWPRLLAISLSNYLELFSLHPPKAIQDSKTSDICPTNCKLFQCRGPEISAYNCYLVFSAILASEVKSETKYINHDILHTQDIH